MPDPRQDDALHRLNRNLTAYVDGETGLPYQALLRFAEPLFDLYNLDLRSAREPGIRRDMEETATLLAVLDTARLLWAYFLLDPEEARTRLVDLRRALIGPEPSRDDDHALIDLLQILNARWEESRLSADRARRETGYDLPSFEQLLSAWISVLDEGTVTRDHSSHELPEALAAFARPIFEQTDLEDPDAVEDALARAQAYWELAQTDGDAFDRRLDRLTARFARRSRTAAQVRTEAQHMAERFRQLFGGRASGAQ